MLVALLVGAGDLEVAGDQLLHVGGALLFESAGYLSPRTTDDLHAPFVGLSTPFYIRRRSLPDREVVPVQLSGLLVFAE
jgi:hypothetical protein